MSGVGEAPGGPPGVAAVLVPPVSRTTTPVVDVAGSWVGVAEMSQPAEITSSRRQAVARRRIGIEPANLFCMSNGRSLPALLDQGVTANHPGDYGRWTMGVRIAPGLPHRPSSI